MRRAYIYALLLLTGTMTLRAQTAAPLNFSARFERDAAGDISLKWTSVPGYRDVLESTTDLQTWNPLTPGLCGYGQIWSLSVPDARSVPRPGGGAHVPLLSYSQRRYNDGTLLLTWTSGGLPWRKKFAPASDWAQIAWPGDFAYTRTDPDPLVPPYRVLVFTFSVTIPDADPDVFTDSVNLTPDAIFRRDRLLSIPVSDITTAIANNPPPAGPESLGTASGGQHALYRVRREILDTDDDLLNDCQEYTWGITDENNAYTHGPTRLDTNEDFDSDGYTNYTELAYGTDMISGSSLHQPSSAYYLAVNFFT